MDQKVIIVSCSLEESLTVRGNLESLIRDLVSLADKVIGCQWLFQGKLVIWRERESVCKSKGGMLG